MLHSRIKAFGERNERKFIMSARLLYLAFLHGRENRYGRHWHHFPTDLMRKAPTTLEDVWTQSGLLGLGRGLGEGCLFKPFIFQIAICQH